jgi:hypothetical protein
VFTLDSKRYKGKLTVSRRLVRVAGQDVTKLLDQARGQAAVTTVALHGTQPPALSSRSSASSAPSCHAATPPSAASTLSPARLARLLSKSPVVLSGAQVQDAVDMLASWLAPARHTGMFVYQRLTLP